MLYILALAPCRESGVNPILQKQFTSIFCKNFFNLHEFQDPPKLTLKSNPIHITAVLLCTQRDYVRVHLTEGEMR